MSTVMVMMRLPYLTLDLNIRLAQLGNTGQMELMYTTNPQDKPGRDLHVVIVRDKHLNVAQDGKLTTAEFRALIAGTVPSDPAPATLDGHATRTQIHRTGELLEYFETVALDLRGTSPSVLGRHLDTWGRRRARFADKWDALDSAARGAWLAEARAVLFEFHGTDAERDVHVVPPLAELAGREHLAPTAIRASVRR